MSGIGNVGIFIVVVAMVVLLSLVIVEVSGFEDIAAGGIAEKSPLASGYGNDMALLRKIDAFVTANKPTFNEDAMLDPLNGQIIDGIYGTDLENDIEAMRTYARLGRQRAYLVDERRIIKEILAKYNPKENAEIAGIDFSQGDSAVGANMPSPVSIDSLREGARAVQFNAARQAATGVRVRARYNGGFATANRVLAEGMMDVDEQNRDYDARAVPVPNLGRMQMTANQRRVDNPADSTMRADSHRTTDVMRSDPNSAAMIVDRLNALRRGSDMIADESSMYT